MAIYKVKKRNWAIVTFDRSKIETALKKAIEASGWKDFSEVQSLTDEILERVDVATGKNIPDIEMIQDKVEEILIKNGHDTVAKTYIIYRQKRTEARHDRDVVVEVGKTMDEYLDQTDWRVNANANSGYSLGWLILNVSWKVTANYWLSHIYPTEIGNAHRNWDYHIHDLDMFCWYCAGWSLRQLLEEGFNGAPNRIESSPPKNLQSAVNQMINFFWTLQNEWAWAQAFSSFDTYLAPFVHKFEEETLAEIEKYEMEFESPEKKQKYVYDKTYKYVLQNLQNFVFWLNVPSRWWTQTPFTNITLDWVCPEDLKDKALYLGWYDKAPYKKKYWELKKEMDLINKVLIEVYIAWDWKWRVFTFPIPTYNITEDFDWDSSNTDLLFEMTAKYWLPYFQNFIGSQFKREKDEKGNMLTVRNKDAYTPGAVRSMCCRLQLDLKELLKRWNGLFGSAEMTGSIWVVTLNLARIGYNCKWDKEAFKARIEHLMTLAKTSLELKREEISKWLGRWFYPYTFRYLKSFRNHFSTIWLNGLNEAIRNFTDWKEDISTIEWMKFGIEILEFMRDILKSYQEETWNLYNLEATPAEW
jgi:ribonucleoside-triphosphate reductase (formate)